MKMSAKSVLADFKPPTKLQLAALWTSVMFLYVYGDYFNLYQPGKLAAVARGELGIGLPTDIASIFAAAMMTIPSLMISLSLALPPVLCKWLNVLFGVLYSLILAATMRGAAPFYLLLGVVEIALTLAIAVIALRWPKLQPG
jgi:hypothetical protein